MRTSYLSLIAILGLFTVTAFGQVNRPNPYDKDKDSKADKKEVVSDTVLAGKLPTGSVMRNIFNSILKLMPYLTSRPKFEDSANEQVILAELVNISLAFNQTHDNPRFAFSGFSPSLSVMQDHLKETLESFNGKHKVFAFTRMKATTQICMSCHEQFPSGHHLDFGPLWKQYEQHPPADNFEFAEFYYLIRNYSKASEYFAKGIDQKLEQIGKEKAKSPEWYDSLIEGQIFNALKKLVITYTLAEYSPSELSKSLEKYHDSKYLSKFTIDSLKEWKKEISLIEKEIPTDFLLQNDKAAKAFIKDHLQKFEDESSSETLSIRTLVAGGILKKFLHSHPKSKATPEILLWIARAERQINRSLFFSLADIYLKECIARFPKTKYAQACYGEYENNVLFGFTGSAGTEVPKEEQKELDILKKKAFGK